MLPRTLCENLCSLNPGEDRLAFSVIWEMTPELEIVGEWFGRTIIRSCTKLSYDHAQCMIKTSLNLLKPEQFPPIDGKHSLSEIYEIVNQLYKISRDLRMKRKADGALRLDQPKFTFSWDPETKTPNGIFLYEHNESHQLIEEFMLLANMAVAHKIYSVFPTTSILRRHAPPHSTPMENTIKALSKHGIYLDPSSSGALAASIEKYIGNDEKSIGRMHVIANLCSKPMQFAKYFCTGTMENVQKYWHYALNVGFYTHFTSPIRRYPDIMVHRLLAAAVEPEIYSVPSLNSLAVEKKAEHCNDKKQIAKNVQTTSSELYLALFIRQLGELEEKGIIIGLLDKSVDILLLKFGVIKRCFMEKLPLVKYEFTKNETENQPIMLLYWKIESEVVNENANSSGLLQTLNFLDFVTVVLRPFENGCLKFNAYLIKPANISS